MIWRLSSHVSEEEVPEGSDMEPQAACLLLQPYIKDPTKTVRDVIIETIAKVGENIKAFLVLNPGETATAEEIIDYCRTKLTNFLLPQEVAFLKSFPKSLVGKILKRELRKL